MIGKCVFSRRVRLFRSGAVDTGAAALPVVGVIFSVLAIFGIVGLYLAAAQARQQSESAADLAALAAADTLRGLRVGVVCDVAAEVALANQVTLQDCVDLGDSVQVRVTGASVLGWQSRGEARAGPPEQR